MRKMFCLMLVLCLALPTLAQAAKYKAPGVLRAQDTLTADQKATFEGKGMVRMGSEKVYVSKDLCKASFTKSDVCTDKRVIKYICPCQDVAKTRPGRCACGKELVPAFKYDNKWFTLSRDDLGQLVVQPAVADVPAAAPVTAEPTVTPEPTTAPAPTTDAQPACSACPSCGK